MTRRVHTVPPGTRTETARAGAAFEAYKMLGPGRSLTRLRDKFVEQAAQARNNPGNTPLPPTTSHETLLEWSAAFDWQARIVDWEREAERARKQELLRQIERQARATAQLMQQVGQGALGVVAMGLNAFVDEDTGALKGRLTARDLAILMRASAEVLQLAQGQPINLTQTDDLTVLETTLREGDEETRKTVLRGLWALWDWQNRHDLAGGQSR
jgi:hypothetical protein